MRRDPASKIFTIAAGLPFAETVAFGLLKHFSTDDHQENMSDVTLLVPTRRAAQSLRDAFLRVSNGAALLLPRLRAIGDVDETALSFQSWGLSGPNILDLPPAIPAMDRLLTLARLVRAFPIYDPATGQKIPPEAPEALRLARALATLLDAIQSEDLDPSTLKTLVMGEHAAHWEDILHFLSIILEAWPAILADKGVMDPITRRTALMRAQADFWTTHPPTTPIIAVGVLASTAATAKVLAAIAQLQQGAIILPGYDPDVTDADWDEVSKDQHSTHPQTHIAKLLSMLNVDRHDVRPWTQFYNAPQLATHQRSLLWTQVIRPAASTTDWRHLGLNPLPQTLMDGLHIIEADTEREEAAVIALAARETLETPGQTVMIVTPDRAIADRIRGELTRWQIVVDDSAGKPLGTTPPGTLLRLSAHMVRQPGAPVALLACLKHPLVAAGWSQPRFRAAVRALEISALRGARIQGGWSELRTFIQHQPTPNDDVLSLLDTLIQITKPLETLMASQAADVRDLIEAHVALCEALTATDTQDGAAEMWAKDAGHVAAEFIADLCRSVSVIEDIPGAQYPAILEALMAGVVVRPSFGWHPRVRILGLMESRGETADRIILAGLNEGIWPPSPTADPWMSRPMRTDFGLPAFEHRIAQAAHDFVQLASHPNVLITRSKKVDRAPSVPSRWLMRLSAVCQASHLQLSNDYGTKLLNWARTIDRRREADLIKPPEPKPPVAARPRSFNITDISRLIKDPYAVYARKVLNLKALEPVDAPLGAAERGTFVHKALEAFTPLFDATPPEERVKKLLEIGQKELGTDWQRDAIWAFWWPRFVRAAEWFVADETERRKTATPVLIEQNGIWEWPSDHGPLKLIGKPDRLDKTNAGETIIIDYKTGQTPSKSSVTQGQEPQLALQGALVREAAFPHVPRDVVELSYLSVTGSNTERDKAIRFAPNPLIEQAQTGLKALLAAFDDQDTPYLSHPDPTFGKPDQDFAHLARIAEWRSAESEEDT